MKTKLTNMLRVKEGKKRNKEMKTTTTKTSAQISPYTKLTQTTRLNVGGQKPKGRKNLILKAWKRRSQTQ